MRGLKDTSRGYFQTLIEIKALVRASETGVYSLNLIIRSQGMSDSRLPVAQIKMLGDTNPVEVSISQLVTFRSSWFRTGHPTSVAF